MRRNFRVFLVYRNQQASRRIEHRVVRAARGVVVVAFFKGEFGDQMRLDSLSKQVGDHGLDILADEGFEFRMFDDVSAASYIAAIYGDRECQAFTRCSHPAMRCDYLRMCFVLAEGGLYVDADDVLLGGGWRHLFREANVKFQPLGYDIAAGGMMPASDIWRSDLPSDGRVFYVNNAPIAAAYVSAHAALRELRVARGKSAAWAGQPEEAAVRLQYPALSQPRDLTWPCGRRFYGGLGLRRQPPCLRPQHRPVPGHALETRRHVARNRSRARSALR